MTGGYPDSLGVPKGNPILVLRQELG